jgi:rod shape-determining protein MreC
MARKHHTKVSNTMLFMWLCMSALILYFAPEKITGKLQSGFANLFSWPLGIGRNITLAGQNPGLSSDNSGEIETQYQNHIANLNKQIHQLQDKVQMLSNIRERHSLEGVKLLACDVITASITGPNNELIINKGVRDGLAKGQYVLGSNSVIGIISQVESRISTVQLITDSESKIPIEIGDQRIPRVLKGIGNNTAKIMFLSRKQKIDLQDVVFARKQPRFLNAEIIAGKILSCKQDENNLLMWDVKVSPACDIEQLTGVSVIIME